MDMINRSGEFIVRIEEYKYHVSLYVLENQFVEVYVNRENNIVEEVEILEAKDERLNAYASEIRIADLF